MIREPWFWREQSIAARILAGSLSPLGAAYNALQKIKWRMSAPASAPLPVICVGNASMGGVGKTPFALMLEALLSGEDIDAHFLTRGYGGHLKGPIGVDPQHHTAIDVGDEALLLAARAPCWVAENRAQGARKAASNNATLAIMDDGFQNPDLRKALSFLLINNTDPEGNGRVFPAGPMREPIDQALERTDCIVLVKASQDDKPHHTLREIIREHRVISCWLEPDDTHLPERVVAFCGIGAPTRFYKTLESCETTVISQFSFPDHHRYTDSELMRLNQKAEKECAVLLTTEKDYYRLPIKARDGISFLPVRMKSDNPRILINLVREILENWTPDQIDER